jgi:hypothetical protein
MRLCWLAGAIADDYSLHLHAYLGRDECGRSLAAYGRRSSGGTAGSPIVHLSPLVYPLLNTFIIFKKLYF